MEFGIDTEVLFKFNYFLLPGHPLILEPTNKTLTILLSEFTNDHSILAL